MSDQAAAEARPNVLFLLADDQRPDTIAARGNPRIATPHLDELAARGVTFTRATCSYPICVVSRAEMLTGRHGWQNGIDGLAGRRFRDGLSFWGEAFRDAGYATSYVGKWHSPGRPADCGYTRTEGLFGSGGGKWVVEGATDWKGFPITGYRGWVFQNADGSEKEPERGVGLTPDIDSKFADAAIEVIRDGAEDERPWFLHVNFTAPHDPLFVPPGLEGKYEAAEMKLPPNFRPEHPFDHGNLKGRDEMLMSFPRTENQTKDVLRVYYSVVDYLDQQVGRILQALDETGQRDETIIIYASDHGMAVGSHGLRGKQNMYEHTINVPLLVAGPGLPSERTTTAQVYLRELFPTTCELAGVPVPGSVTARSFAKVLRKPEAQAHGAIFGYFRDSQRMIRDDRWKLIHYPVANRWQMFDLEADPHELINVYGREDVREIQEALARRLLTWRHNLDDPVLEEAD